MKTLVLYFLGWQIRMLSNILLHTLCAFEFRHEKPSDPDDPLSNQNMRDRYYGQSDPVANKIMNRAKDFCGVFSAPTRLQLIFHTKRFPGTTDTDGS